MALVARLREQDAIRSDRVADVFRTVPRHVFAPEEPLEVAYANKAVVIKRDGHGSAMSSSSAPWLQATMLDQTSAKNCQILWIKIF